MAILPSTIIGMQHFQPLRDEIAKTKTAIAEQALAMKAGIGKAENTDKLQTKLDKLNQIKNTYFPGM